MRRHSPTSTPTSPSLSPSPSPSPSPAPQPPQSTLSALRSTCLSLLLAHQSHPTHSTFSSLHPPPKPLLSPLCELTHAEKTLLALWDELRDVVHVRLKAEARAELVSDGVIKDDEDVAMHNDDNSDQDGGGDDDDEQEVDEALTERIRTLENQVSLLESNHSIKEAISLSAITSREIQNAIYGIRGAESLAPPSSIAKNRSLRALTALHTTHLTHLTTLHTRLTTLQTHLHTLTADRHKQTHTNRSLTSQLLALTTRLSSFNHKASIQDPHLRETIEELEDKLTQMKLRWEVARNVFMGVVAGSGVDWVRMEEGKLRGLMLMAGEEVE